MTLNKIEDRYEDAYVDFSVSFEAVLKLREKGIAQNERKQRELLREALADAKKYYKVASRYYQSLDKERRRYHDAEAIDDLGYLKSEIRWVKYSVWRLGNAYKGQKIGRWLKFPEAPALNLAY